MRLRQNRTGMQIDVSRIAVSAADALLDGENQSRNGGVPERRQGLGAAGAVAVGVVLGAAARAAYVRARSLDLERVASAVEERLR
jgi:hypothetical protein